MLEVWWADAGGVARLSGGQVQGMQGVPGRQSLDRARGMAGDDGVAQNPLHSVVVARDARVGHEQVEALAVRQQRSQKPALRIHAGQLDPCRLPLPVQPIQPPDGLHTTLLPRLQRRVVRADAQTAPWALEYFCWIIKFSHMRLIFHEGASDGIRPQG